MSKKHSPIFNRLGILLDWKAHYDNTDKKEFKNNIHKINLILKVLKLYEFFILKETFRINDNLVEINIYSNISSFVQKIPVITKKLEQLGIKCKINYINVKRPYFYSRYIALSIKKAIQQKYNYKKVITDTIKRASISGILGCRVRISGRLKGAELHTSELFGWGKVSLNTMNYNIDYTMLDIQMSYGVLGLKVWVNTEYKDIKKLDNLI